MNQTDKKNGSPLSDLNRIKKSWPGKIPQNVVEIFERLRKHIKPSDVKHDKFFDPFLLIRRVLATHDLLFLSRQVTYHIAADSQIPKIWAEEDQMQFVFSLLVEHTARRSLRGSRIRISMKESTLRGGPGLEINFSNEDKHLADIDQDKFLAELFEEKEDAISGVYLSDCRKAITKEGGRFWVDFRRADIPVYHVLLPTSEVSVTTPKVLQQIFKYEIVVTNNANIRKSFGIKKSKSLVMQIEHYVKSLVRYPVDMVISTAEKGIVVAIYESASGGAQTVASRISERLGAEKFYIGKKLVDLTFSYHLYPLSSQNSVGRKS